MFIQAPLSSSEELAYLSSSAAQRGSETHALIVGRHTLAPMLALMKAGYVSVETHALDAPVGHLHPASLVLITDARSDHEIAHAVRHAATCLVTDGQLVLDAAEAGDPSVVATALSSFAKAGFRLVSIRRHDGRVVLVATRRREALAS